MSPWERKREGKRAGPAPLLPPSPSSPSALPAALPPSPPLPPFPSWGIAVSNAHANLKLRRRSKLRMSTLGCNKITEIERCETLSDLEKHLQPQCYMMVTTEMTPVRRVELQDCHYTVWLFVAVVLVVVFVVCVRARRAAFYSPNNCLSILVMLTVTALVHKICSQDNETLVSSSPINWIMIGLCIFMTHHKLLKSIDLNQF